MSERPNVAIVGAGFAGLRCADILIQNGAQVTVFEARDRVGGRVHQSKVGDHLIDMGPNWIHGAGANPILDIANATGTTYAEFEGGQVVFGSDGKVVDEAVAARVSDVLWTTVEEAFKYSNAHKDDIPADKSLLDFIQERLGETELNEQEKRICLESARLWGAYVGDPIERQSLKFFSLEESIDGSNYFVASTYKGILKHVSATALEKADIRLNQPIVKIDSKQLTQGTSTGTREVQVTLTTQSGKSHAFDEVVVTCPLGWLKRNKESFTPALPPRLATAIDSISYGRLEKVYITFPEAFWHTETVSENTVLLPIAATNGTASPPNSNSNSTNTNEGTNSNTSTLTFAQFLNPTYHTDHPPDIPWDQKCFSLAALPEKTAHPTLLFYTYGPAATYIVNKLTELSQTNKPQPETKQTSPNNSYQEHPPSTPGYDLLTTIFAPFYSHLPHYTANSPSCKPTAITSTSWQTDPYSGHGSYSNFQVGLSDGYKDIETLRSGDGMGIERGIWFAGEHTAPFVALGTTTGAFWSGERAAGGICGVRNLGRVGVGKERDDSLPSQGLGQEQGV
ncbi:flavin monoamine oxidase family protein [Aspergillus undulatus]|uniref:flavin monoamine oxidase family protein n=1 Tax=Aspergillus undulatus TaxID=1810928 RepID=UPI003CCDF231